MEKEILYKYAENSAGKIIHIDNAVKGNEYFCPGCKQSFIFKHGQIRRHHFAHKNDTDNCSKETYLHELGKKIFCETYEQCLNANEPFYISTSVSAVCKYNGITQYKNCIKGATVPFDLTSSFKHIECEKNHGNFRPDITLSNDFGDIIFIEIAVTHPCDKEKIASKNKIIEINIKDESDVSVIIGKTLTDQSEFIKNFSLEENLHDKGEDIKFYNFENFNVLVEPICNDNTLLLYLFTLKDGRNVLIQRRKRETCQLVYENINAIQSIKPIIPRSIPWRIKPHYDHDPNHGGPGKTKHFNSKYRRRHNHTPKKRR
ncbi:MAG: hypothetical protein LBG84_00095 [Treponema sp.]|jgi:hypothetical protein|nr:hypothetical protein [Treponema sp.]